MSRNFVRGISAVLPVVAYRGLTGGLPILLSLVIAHRWGLQELAGFTVANAAVAVLLAIVDWGAVRALPRDLSTLSPEEGAKRLGAVNSFRLALVSVIGLGVWILIADSRVDALSWPYLVLLLPLTVIASVTGNAVAQRLAAGETGGIAAAVSGGLAFLIVAGTASVLLTNSPRVFVAVFVLSRVVEALIVTSGRWWVASVARNGAVRAGILLWPFAIQSILGVAYARAAVFTVERMSSRAELSLFSLATALYSALMLIPVSVAITNFPSMTRAALAGDRAETRMILRRYVVLTMAGVLTGIAVLAIALPYTAGRFALSAASRGFVLAYCSLAFVSAFSTLLGFRLQANGREHLAARLSALTLVAAILFQLTALKFMGLWGIVVAAFASEAFTLVVFGAALQVRRHER